jgi:E3 ubiquitin-protein ligase TRIP12
MNSHGHFRKRSDLFRVLGQFVAKALLDSRIIDICFNRTFLKPIMGEDVTRSVDTLMVRHKDTTTMWHLVDIIE